VHVPNELLRKTLHIGFGLFALALRWLPWWLAALVALGAVAGNWLVLHRIVGKSVARHERGWDAGIVIYPAAVFVLIVVFRNRIEIAGATWAILAFGDGFATLAGKQIRGPRLPWNRDKSWSGLTAFLLFGFVAAFFVFRFLQTRPTVLPPMAIVAVAVLVAAIVESLDLRINDNITVPLAGGAAMAAMAATVMLPQPSLDPSTIAWLGANTLLAALGYLARSVDLSGLGGGWLLGALVIVFGGWQLYVVLLAFFIIGTGATKLGYRRKAARGLAQEQGGRRGFSHAFANTGMSAMLAIVATTLPAERADFVWLAAAAALATATADTTASEVGQLLGRRTFLPLTLRAVPPGTEGAISLEGTLAGAAAGFVVAVVTCLAHFRHPEWPIVGMLTVSAFAGSYIESIAGSWNRKQEQPIPNGVLNFFNTAVGAAVYLLWSAVA